MYSDIKCVNRNCWYIGLLLHIYGAMYPSMLPIDYCDVRPICSALLKLGYQFRLKVYLGILYIIKKPKENTF